MTEHTLDTDLIKEFVTLENEIDDLLMKVAILQDRKKQIVPTILDQMATTGIDNMKVGGRTVFPTTKTFAQIKSKADGIQALKDAGLFEYVTEGFNSNSVSAFVRERIKNGEDLPEEFGDRIIVGERIDLSSRRAS